jgi:riboflavin synthase alpha subunit
LFTWTFDRAEKEAVKLSLVVKRLKRTEQMKRNLGDKINMIIDVGIKEKESQS